MKTPKTTRGERLRTARIAAGFKSGAAAAKELGIPQPTLNAHERAEEPGGRDYGPDEAARYARRYKVDDTWLLTAKGRGPAESEAGHVDSEQIAHELSSPSESRRMVKLKGYVGAGSEAHFYAVADEDFEEVEAPLGSNDQTTAVEIRGKSWGPLMDSWLVFYDDIRSPVTDDLLGWPCVVGLADDRILLKQIKRERDGSYTLLSNSNEAPMPDAQIEWAAKVTTMRPR